MTTTAQQPTTPWWVEQARARKAAMIAAELRAMGATAADAVAFTAADRRQAEAVAGTRRGSDDTWRVVTEMLAGSARHRSLCPFCGLGDPEGVPGPPKAFGHAGPCRP